MSRNRFGKTNGERVLQELRSEEARRRIMWTFRIIVYMLLILALFKYLGSH